MKTPEQRKTTSLLIGFIGIILMMFGQLVRPGIDALGVMLIVVALVIYFRARGEEKRKNNL